MLFRQQKAGQLESSRRSILAAQLPGSVPCWFVGESGTGHEAKGERKRIIVSSFKTMLAALPRLSIRTVTILVRRRACDGRLRVGLR